MIFPVSVFQVTRIFGFLSAISKFPISFQQIKLASKSWDAIKSILYLSSSGTIEISKADVKSAILLVVILYSSFEQKAPLQLNTSDG